MKAVTVNNLSFNYKNSEEKIIKDLSFEIQAGEITVIVGKSGSGKTTLCNCICGLIPSVYTGHMSGEIKIFNKNIRDMTLSERVTSIGIIFQNPTSQIFSPTIEDELAFGPENLSLDREEIGRRIDGVLRRIKMEQYRFDNPNNLSGGQQQLIALGSVLTLDPKILICDEIMSFVDEEGKRLIKSILLSLRAEGKTIIMVDHNISNIDIADNIIHI